MVIAKQSILFLIAIYCALTGKYALVLLAALYIDVLEQKKRG